jgi:hypothetical protein
MAISLDCTCGQAVLVELSQAGGETTCRCGQTIRIPSLSKLRELSGKGAYEAGIIDTIQRMVASGELPAGDRCVVSAEPTEDVFEFYVEAERVAQVGTSVAQAALVSFLCSPVLAIAMTLKPIRDVGRSTIVLTPLRVCAKHQPRVLKSSQRALKRWLRTVPVYAQLLKDYPRARILLEAPGEMKPFTEKPEAAPNDVRDPDFEF